MRICVMFESDFLDKNDCILHCMIVNYWCVVFILFLIFCVCLGRLILFDRVCLNCVCNLYFCLCICSNLIFCVRMKLMPGAGLLLTLAIFVVCWNQVFSTLLTLFFWHWYCWLCFFAPLGVFPPTLCGTVFLLFCAGVFGLGTSDAFAPYCRSHFVFFCPWSL